MGDLALIDILAKVLGRRLVIELSNDTTVDGILLSTLPNCFRLGNSKVYTQSDRSPVCCVNCFVEKKRVRFIHFPQDIHLYNIQKKLMECPVDFLKRFDLVTTNIHTNNNGKDILTFNAFSKHFHVDLQYGLAPLFRDFTLKDGSDKDISRDLIRNTRFYSARVQGVMHSSGFITVGKQTHELIGRLDLFNDTLYLEPTEDGTKSLVYFKSDLDLDGLHNFSSKAFHRPHFQFSYRPASFFEQYRGKRNNEEKIVKNNRCEIKLVADYAFYRLIGNGNYANAARYLINLIERINVIFRDVDWGLSARGERLKNLGFTIKEMKIHERKNNLSSHFNYISPNRYANADQVLQSFSRTEGANTCITFLISGKVFDMGILGLANIGNVGEKRGVCGESNTNTGVVSVQRKSGLIITSVVDLVVAHEIGHLWGSNHDAIDDPRCVPTDSPEGRYIMHESSNSGYDRNNYRFSPCSKMAIHRVLYTAVDQCFVDEQKSLCGNNIVEAGEECDPGGQLLTGTAVHNDTCCTSQCKLKINAKCSPKHSECCTKDCSYLPATHLCQPSNKNNCSQPAFCTGYSAKCPEPKPVPDGTDCFDEGKCLSGKCIDFCHQISSSSSPCNCEKPKEMCMRCCRSPAGHCEPVKPVRYLVNGSICIHGRCNNKLCVKEVTDAATHFWRIIKDIRDNPSSEHLAHYIVFITICATLLVWGPCVACVMYNDRRKRRHRVRMAQPDDNFAKSGMSRSVSNPQNSKLL